MSITAGEIIWKINGDTSGFDRDIKKTENSAKGLGKIFAAVGVGVVAIGAGLVSMAKSALGGASALEKNEIALTTMLKSGTKARALLQEFREFGASTPFETTEIIKAGKQLVAFGVSAGEVTNTLRRIGDVAAGVGVPLGSLAEIYGKIKVSSTVYNEDLNQLAGRGIPIFTELAKVMGVNATEIKKMSSQGKIGFTQIEQAFKNMTKEGGTFAGLMEAQSKSLGGLYSTLTSQLSEMSTEVGQKLAPAFKELLVTLTSSQVILPAIKAMFSGIAGVINGFVVAINWAINAIENLGKSLRAIDRKEEIAAIQSQINHLNKSKSAYLASANGAARFAARSKYLKGILVDLRIEQTKYNLEQIKASKTNLRKTLLDSTKGLNTARNALNETAAGSKNLTTSFTAMDNGVSKTYRTVDRANRAVIGFSFTVKKVTNETEKLTLEETKQKNELRKLLQERQKLNGEKIVGPATKYNATIQKTNKNIKKTNNLVKEQTSIYDNLPGPIRAIAVVLDNVEKKNKNISRVMGQLKDSFSMASDAYSTMISSIMELQTAMSDNAIYELERELEAKLKAAGLSEETSLEQAEREYQEAKEAGDAKITEEKRVNFEREKLKDEYDKKILDAEYDAALVAWQLEMSMAAVAVPMAILNALTSGFKFGPIAAGINAALAGAAAGIQVAALASAKPKKPSYQSGGIVGGSQFAGDNISARVNSGEMILNGAQQAQLFNIANGNNNDNGLTPVKVSESSTWSEIYQASKNGALFIDKRSIISK